MKPFPWKITGLLLGAFLFAQNSHAEDDSQLVSIDGTDAPAVDLVYQGKPIDQDQAAGLRKKGVDLSALDPVPNDMFGKPSLAGPIAMPPEGATLDYGAVMAGFGHELSVHQVYLGGIPFRLDVSTVPHRALFTRALLAKLGYNQYEPKRYQQLTIRFASIADRAAFIDAVTLHTAKDTSIWIVSAPDGDPTLTLRDIILEPGKVEISNYYWSVLSSDFSGGRRAMRALLVPIALADAPENIDSYTWDIDQIFSNSVQIRYPLEIDQSKPFQETSIDDLRWAAKRVAKLSVADWQAIVAKAEYPADIGQLVLQKVLARRDQLLTSLSIKAAALPYNAHLNNNSVKNGEVMQATFPGYASRFSYGDAEDPMSPSELTDFGLFQGLASAMETLAGQVNQRLVIMSTAPYAQQQSNKVFQDFLNHMATNPNQPYTQPISSWGGPVGGFSVSAARQVTTGTFYGSSAPIQFVDTMGFTASIGYFRALDGLKNFIPSAQLNLSVNRSYSHVRALTKVSDGFKISAADFVIPKLLHDLSVILSNPKKTPSATETAAADSQKMADYTQAVEDLLSKIADGEMFTITDTLAGGPSAAITVPLQALLPSVPVGFNQNITFGASAQGVILKRTTLRRVHDQTTGDNFLQIYVQTMDAATGSLTLDFNYYINILHLQHDVSKGHARTRVYTIKSDPSRPEETAKSLAMSIRSLLRSNSDASLQSSYPFYLLNHSLNESDWQFNFLFFQAKEMEERHQLLVQPPTQPDHAFNPKDFERNLYAYRKLSRTGTSYMNVLSDAFSALTGGQGQLNNSSGSNPAYSLGGKAHWVEQYSDGELTKGTDFTPFSSSRETWAGWSINQKDLFKVFDIIDSKLGNLKRFGLNVSPIHRDVFKATSQLEFYNVTTTLAFYPNGVFRIVNALEPSVNPKNYHPNFFEKMTVDSFSDSDLPVFKTLESWLGGEGTYNSECEKFYNPDEGDSHNTFAVWKGNTYICLEPWVSQVLLLRRNLPSSSDRVGQIEWQTRMIELLEQKVSLPILMQVAGKDGFFYQVSVSGFRKGDHEAKDSEQNEVIASYVSDTVGTANLNIKMGAFAALSAETKIIPYEVNGLFFTSGD
ncbi:MAG: hypothetical protein ACXVB9_11970 [Bdellovibrionota bacterium]